jgi:hypothetical protein
VAGDPAGAAEIGDVVAFCRGFASHGRCGHFRAGRFFIVKKSGFQGVIHED